LKLADYLLCNNAHDICNATYTSTKNYPKKDLGIACPLSKKARNNGKGHYPASASSHLKKNLEFWDGMGLKVFTSQRKFCLLAFLSAWNA